MHLSHRTVLGLFGLNRNAKPILKVDAGEMWLKSVQRCRAVDSGIQMGATSKELDPI